MNYCPACLSPGPTTLLGLTGVIGRRRVRSVPLVQLDVAAGDRTVTEERAGPVIRSGSVTTVAVGRGWADEDGELVVVDPRLSFVIHPYPVATCPLDAVLAGPEDVAGRGVDELVVADARPVHLSRRGGAVVVVLEVAPEGAVLDAAPDAEIAVDPAGEAGVAAPNDEPAARHEIAGDR